MRSHRAGLRLGANMRPRTCGSESVVCPMGDTVAPSDAQTLSSPTSQPSLGVRARGPLCLPCRDALGAQMTPRLKPRRAPSSFPPAPPGATRSHPVSPSVTQCHPASPGHLRGRSSPAEAWARSGAGRQRGNRLTAAVLLRGTRPSQRPLCAPRRLRSPVSAPGGHRGSAAVFPRGAARPR